VEVFLPKQGRAFQNTQKSHAAQLQCTPCINEPAT